MKASAHLRPRRVFAVVALNVHSGQRKLAGILRFFNEKLPREEAKWDIDILRGKDAITDTAMRRAVREGVSGIILLNYPTEETMRLVTRCGGPCVVETAGGSGGVGGSPAASPRETWSIDPKTLDPTTLDLSVVNPNIEAERLPTTAECEGVMRDAWREIGKLLDK